MNQRREGLFWVIEEETNYESRFAEREDFAKRMKELEFTKVKTVETNKFSTPFLDIWLNPEQTHQVCFVHDPVVDTNYICINPQSNLEQESISKLSDWFYCDWNGELYEAADEALEENDEDTAPRAIFNLAVNCDSYNSKVMVMFERYLNSSSEIIRLATIRAVGFQLWSECIPLLEKVIEEDYSKAVTAVCI